MAKEKTEFEILANTLKAMNKQCTAKVKCSRAALTAIFVSFKTQLAYACDGHRLAILDLNGHMDHKEVEELAFYADMQAIEYANGFALISAKKKTACSTTLSALPNIYYQIWRKIQVVCVRYMGIGTTRLTD